MSPMQGSMAPEPCADHNISLPLKIQNMTMCVCFQSKACEAHLFIEFSRQEYGCGLPFPPPGIFPTQGLNRHLLCLLHWQADSLPLSHLGSPTNHSVQSLSRVRLCDPMNRSTPGLPVHHQLLEFTQTHVHRVHDAIQPSHPRSTPSPPAPNPSQHQSLLQ